jgi:HAD superfamily 5'-nucleotidase-like hydrolase
MRAIKVIGYDMDYTLVHYNVAHWERRAYEHVRAKLASMGWPVDALVFDPDLVVRGLIIDTEHGNILKVNRFGYVKTGYHGTERIDYESLRSRYARTIVDLADARYRFLNTLFALSEGCMYAQLVDRFDADELPDDVKTYRQLYECVRASIDATHMEGELKAEIISQPERYVELDPETVLTLFDQHHAGKKLVLITNSEWSYTSAMMSYAFDRFMPEGSTWRDLFDLSIVAARKPAFFEARAPLLAVVDAERGWLAPHIGPLAAHAVYFGGHASLVEEHFGVTGDEILYLGDHIYGDVHVSKSVLRWRTGLILRELEGELAAIHDSREDEAHIVSLMREKEQLEYKHYRLRLALQRKKRGYGPEVRQSATSLNTQLARLRESMIALDGRIAPLAKAASEVHNARWGLLMRAGNDKSQLARQIERYADIYTSRVSNLSFATPFVYLRSPRGSLPHDPVPSRK